AEELHAVRQAGLRRARAPGARLAPLARDEQVHVPGGIHGEPAPRVEDDVEPFAPIAERADEDRRETSVRAELALGLLPLFRTRRTEGHGVRSVIHDAKARLRHAVEPADILRRALAVADDERRLAKRGPLAPQVVAASGRRRDPGPDRGRDVRLVRS